MIETLFGGDYYVYAYLDPRKAGNFMYGEYCFNYEPIYIGKGKNGRAYQFKRKKENKYLDNKFGKFGKPIIEFITENLTEKEAFNREVELIKLIGRYDLGAGPLANQTDGGDGASGNKQSKETIEKRVRKLKGKSHSQATKNMLSKMFKGRPIPEEQKIKISLSLRGKKQSKETIEKRASKMRGHVVTEETKRKIAAPQIGRVFTEEQKRNMSNAHRGVPLSEEHKKAKSIAAKIWWAERKAA